MATAAEGLPEAGAQPAKRKGPGSSPSPSCPLLSVPVSGFGPWPRGGGRALPGRGLLPARQQPSRGGKGSGGGVGAGCRAGPRLRVCLPAGRLLPWSPAAASRQGRTVVCLSPPSPRRRFGRREPWASGQPLRSSRQKLPAQQRATCQAEEEVLSRSCEERAKGRLR